MHGLLDDIDSGGLTSTKLWHSCSVDYSDIGTDGRMVRVFQEKKTRTHQEMR